MSHDRRPDYIDGGEERVKFEIALASGRAETACQKIGRDEKDNGDEILYDLRHISKACADYTEKYANPYAVDRQQHQGRYDFEYSPSEWYVIK